MAKKPRLQAEIVPNQDCRLYHTNFVMTEERLGQMFDGIMLRDEEKKLNTAPEAVKNLAIGVQSIPGILIWNFHRYQLQVVKAPLFDWNEIEPQIVGLIRTVGQELLGEEVEYIEKPI